MVSVPLALDNVRSVNDLGLLMFVGESERTTAELFEYYETTRNGLTLRRLRRFEALRLLATRDKGRGLLWSLTDAGRSALRQLADNINAVVKGNDNERQG